MAIRPGGTICLIGVLSGARADLLIPLIGSRNVNLQGVSVGTREALEDMMRGMAANNIKPVIDSVYPAGGRTRRIRAPGIRCSFWQSLYQPLDGYRLV